MNATNLLYLRTFIKMSNEKLIEIETSGKLAKDLIKNNNRTILHEIDQIPVDGNLNDYVSQIKGILMFYYCGDNLSKILKRLNDVLEKEPSKTSYKTPDGHYSRLGKIYDVQDSLREHHSQLKKNLDGLINLLMSYCTQKMSKKSTHNLDESESKWINSFSIYLIELCNVHLDDYTSYKKLVENLSYSLLTDADLEILRNNIDIKDYRDILHKRNIAIHTGRQNNTSDSYSSYESISSQGYFPPSGYGPEAIYNP